MLTRDQRREVQSLRLASLTYDQIGTAMGIPATAAIYVAGHRTTS